MTFYPCGEYIDDVTVDNLMSMGPSIFPWIQFLFILIPPHF